MNTYIVPNLSKAVQILKLLASADQGITAVDIEQRLQIPRTTAFRILKTLVHEGVVQKNGTTFFAGTGLFEIGLQALSHSKLREKSVGILRNLTRVTGQTSHLAVPSGRHSLILEVCDSPEPVRVASRPGTLVDLYCSATGKIFLSYLYDADLSGFLEAVSPVKRTPNTLTEALPLKQALERIRSERFAIDEEEYHPGVRCLAAPVFDMQGQVTAAIGVTGTTVSLTPDSLPAMKQHVMSAAGELSSALGYK